MHAVPGLKEFAYELAEHHFGGTFINAVRGRKEFVCDLADEN